MDRKQAEDFIYSSYLRASKHQEYGKRDSEKRHPELTKEIIERLSQSRDQNPVNRQLLVTGSKGKGSVAFMISSLLKESIRVGLFTSPHIIDFTERFRVNGEMISDAMFTEIVTELEPYFTELDKSLAEDVCISPMGIETAIALSFFEREHTDFNVLECGKGARHDDVNNVPHRYAVINSIFPEHLRELGSNIKEIAEDKKFIITEDVKRVYIAEQEPEVLEILKKRAEEVGAECKIYGQDFRAENIEFTDHGIGFDVIIGKRQITGIELMMPAVYQAKNCALSLAAVIDIMKDLAGVSACCTSLNPSIRRALRTLRIPGRMEIVSERPWILLDACINEKSFFAVEETLRNLGIEKAAFIIGIPDDKDYLGVARAAAPFAEHIYLCGSGNPHYIFTKKQEMVLKENQIPAEWKENPDLAIQDAAKSGLPIIILGTTSLISEIEARYRAYP